VPRTEPLAQLFVAVQTLKAERAIAPEAYDQFDRANAWLATVR
jgi:hypothetical protein